MSNVSRYDGHLHSWDLAGHPNGTIHATCECGHERLVSDTGVVRGRVHRDRNWITPKGWNRPTPEEHR